MSSLAGYWREDFPRSLGVTFGLLLGGVIVSLYKTRGEQPPTLTDATPPEKRTAADNAGTSRSPRP